MDIISGSLKLGSSIQVTAAIIIKKEQGIDSVLLVQNKKNPKKGCYGFPGGVGAFKKYSEPEEAVVEEVRGDIGCVFSGTFFGSFTREEDDTLYNTLVFVGTIDGNPHPVCENIIDTKFVPIEEATKMDLAYDHNIILRKYLTEL